MIVSVKKTILCWQTKCVLMIQAKIIAMTLCITKMVLAPNTVVWVTTPPLINYVLNVQ